jgi:hypothetical protein
VGHLKLRDGRLHDSERMDETQAIWVKTGLHSGLVHQRTDRIMGDQQGVQFLDHADGLEAAQGAIR